MNLSQSGRMKKKSGKVERSLVRCFRSVILLKRGSERCKVLRYVSDEKR